jgi:hypothetical protein
MPSHEHQFRAGDACEYHTTDGPWLPSSILRMCADSPYAIIRIKGRLGTHWEPLVRLRPTTTNSREIF